MPPLRPPYPIAGWEMRLRGGKGLWRETTAAAGVKDTAFAAAGVPGICPGWREPDPPHPFRNRR